MGTLCVIDVSAVVHTGENSPLYQNRTSFGYPVGGIHFFMSQLLVAYYESNDIILCFDSPNFRSKLQTSYKSGRSRNAAAISEIEALYENLQYCGFPCYKQDGYEADDIIEWVVEQNWKRYTNIIIVGNDKDLCHSLRPNVIFRACRSDMNLVRRASFPDAVIKGAYIPFNMVSIYKCLCGCQSDSVPVFRLEDGRSGSELYTQCVTDYEQIGITDDYYKTTSVQIFKAWAASKANFSATDMENLDVRIQLIFPAECPEGLTFETVNKYQMDIEKISRVLTLFNVNDALHGGEFWRVNLSDEDKQIIYDLANKYKSGVFNADKNIPMTESLVRSTPLRLDSFSKDF